uniref:Secreted protein n=1 Tax=Ixodes ricinus TaxID=34613 RepID=A0A6B0UVY6_IXORI
MSLIVASIRLMLSCSSLTSCSTSVRHRRRHVCSMRNSGSATCRGRGPPSKELRGLWSRAWPSSGGELLGEPSPRLEEGEPISTSSALCIAALVSTNSRVYCSTSCRGTRLGPEPYWMYLLRHLCSLSHSALSRRTSSRLLRVMFLLYSIYLSR